MRHPSLSSSSPAILVLVVMGMGLAGPAGAQEDSLPSATYARRGLIIGGMAGGAAGAAFIGLLAQGLCEYDCDGAFLTGMLYGGVGGSILGGLTGLVIGAALPRNVSDPGEEAGPKPPQLPPREPGDAAARDSASGGVRSWAVRVGVGPTWPIHTESGRTRTWASLAVLRPTSSRVDWGVEAGYLGTRTEENIFTVAGREGDTAMVVTRWERRLWSASLMALRTLGREGRPRGYLLATAGVYPYREWVESTRTGDPPDSPMPQIIHEASTDPLPGVGLGGGGRWRLGDRVSLGVDSRLHVILGAGDDLGVAVASLGAVLWLGR